MTPSKYLDLKEAIIKKGYADEIIWAEDLKPCKDWTDFFFEYVFVVCNSGMKYTIAIVIYRKIIEAIKAHENVRSVFGHPGKAAAIEKVRENALHYFAKYQACKTDIDKIAYLETLPWIGKITKYHLAKNLGITTVAKPDRHLDRIAKKYGTTPQEMCEQLSRSIGDTVAVVDLVIWRAASLGIVYKLKDLNEKET